MRKPGIEKEIIELIKENTILSSNEIVEKIKKSIPGIYAKIRKLERNKQIKKGFILHNRIDHIYNAYMQLTEEKKKEFVDCVLKSEGLEWLKKIGS